MQTGRQTAHRQTNMHTDIQTDIEQVYLSNAIQLLFQILKDFFLLGRGELFSAFIEHARSLLKLPPTDNTSHGKIYLLASLAVSCFKTY